MGDVIRLFRRSLLDLNADELERALVRRSECYRLMQEARRRWMDADDQVHELNAERAKLLAAERR